MANNLIAIPFGNTADGNVLEFEIVERGSSGEAANSRELYMKIKAKDNTLYQLSLRSDPGSDGKGVCLLHNSPASSASNGEVVTAEWVRNYVKSSGSVPIGSILPWASNNINGIPSGFLLCNGQEVSRSTYSSLYNLIGTSYGGGNGSTTFNVPNMNGRSLWGVTSNSQLGYIDGSLPNITGEAGLVRRGPGSIEHFSGALYEISRFSAGIRSGEGDDWGTKLGFNAARSNGTYGRDGNTSYVRPTAIKTLFIIRAV